MGKQYWDMPKLNRYDIKVPTTVPKELLLRILAAALSYDMDNKSIDYTYKKWEEVWEKELLSSER